MKNDNMASIQGNFKLFHNFTETNVLPFYGSSLVLVLALFFGVDTLEEVGVPFDELFN